MCCFSLFLSSLFYFILYNSATQYLKLVLGDCLPFFSFCLIPTILGQVPKLFATPTFSFFLSFFATSEVKACFSLSRLLVRLLNCCWDIMVISQRYEYNVDSCYILLHLPGHKIFTQLGAYCPTNYCLNNRVIWSLYGGDPYSRQFSRNNYHFSACTTHNGAQHKVSTKKATLLNTTQLQG